MKSWKKLSAPAVFTAFAILASGQAMANDTNTGPGCGLGKMIFSGSTGIIAHTSAGATNASSYQPFAITSGTSGCDASSQVRRGDDTEFFVASNLDSLAQEIAQGQGDHLTTLAVVMGIGKADHGQFFKVAQENYGTLFSSAQTKPSDMLASLEAEMNSHPRLSMYIQ